MEHLLVPALLTIKSNERKHTRRRRRWQPNMQQPGGGFLRREAPDLTSRLIDPFSKSACLGGAPSLAAYITLCTHSHIHLCRCFIHTYNLLQSSFMEEGPSREHAEKVVKRQEEHERSGVGCQAKQSRAISGEAGEILKLGWVTHTILYCVHTISTRAFLCSR